MLLLNWQALKLINEYNLKRKLTIPFKFKINKN